MWCGIRIGQHAKATIGSDAKHSMDWLVTFAFYAYVCLMAIVFARARSHIIIHSIAAMNAFWLGSMLTSNPPKRCSPMRNHSNVNCGEDLSNNQSCFMIYDARCTHYMTMCATNVQSVCQDFGSAIERCMLVP